MSDNGLLRTLLLVGVVLLFAPLLLGWLFTFGGSTMMGGGMMAFGAPMFGGWLLFVALVLGAGYLLLSGRETGAEEPADRTARTRDRENTDDEALATLRDRYARGDLGDEEFERKVEALLETESPEDARDRIRDRER
ncbi:SHOCT domain-containing protein [Halalkaliarchaeum sp. AArc-GB]|uniref:SHOCT domain-containing protein n=1 Tax=unclassified Halalkaliarchaeum TaxID=2678344 RepID=UPI00217E26A2|nr:MULTISPECIES: SHOCT domain-containing protein [unclassified Halalkaliarchaeum]MDR5672286.1 SHOCT domain-containing protein [Halalkaliarchaeum sp. AArc-GB]